MARSKNRWFVVLALLALAGAYGFAPGVRAQVREGKAEPAEKKAEPMMMCPMMEGLAGIELYAESPAVLLGRTEELDLSERQKERLEQIERTAREQARKVLSAKQRQELKDAPDDRLSMMELCMLQMKHIEKDKKASKPMCPMCRQMMEKMRKKKASEQDRKNRTE